MLYQPSLQENDSNLKIAHNDKQDVDIQNKLQTLNFNVNMEYDSKGDFLQHIAVRNGVSYLPLLMAMVKTHGADIQLSNIEGMTPLMLAAAAGNCVLCDVLICIFEADPNKPNSLSGRTALHYAVEGNHRKTVECLIQRGADINIVDNDDLRADDILQTADDDCREIIAFNRIKRMERLCDLIKKGDIFSTHLLSSDLCVIDTEGMTLIMLAATHNKPKCLHHLLKVNKSTINAQHSKTGMTALAMSARLGNLEATEVLLRHNACALITDMAGYIPLHHAVMNNQGNVVDIFLNHFPHSYVGLYKAMHLCKNTSIQAKLKFAWEKRQEKIVRPKLLECAINGNAEELFGLLDEGDSINQKGCIGILALHLAVQNCHLEVLQLLLENGGDIARRHPVTGSTLLHVAAKMGYLDIVLYLLQFCKYSHKKHPASLIGKSSKTDKYFGKLKSFLDVNAVDIDNKTALQLAAEKGLSEIVNLLLSHGATASILGSDDQLLTCAQFEEIHLAIETYRQQHTHEIMKIIDCISAKELSVLQEIWLPRFDHHLRDKEGNTPLMVAAKSGNIQVIQFLLESAVYLEKTQSEIERENIDDADSDTDSGVLDLAVQDCSNIEDEFEISCEKTAVSPDTDSHISTKQNYLSSELQGCAGITDCSELHQRRLIPAATDTSRHKSQSIYHGGLVSHVCAMNLKNGQNVLHSAIHNKDAPHILALFLERDPLPLNMQDDRGETVLHLACRLGRQKSVKLFLGRPDIDLNIHTFDGYLPEEVASSKVIQKMVEMARPSSSGQLQKAR
uniref:Uncharacterized protein n=2 Tax=Arion vulgaris TaxID=1028688 RepID=A0A0B7AJI4_9EUPU